MSNQEENQLQNLSSGFVFREFIKMGDEKLDKLSKPLEMDKNNSIFDKIVRKRFDSLDYTSREREHKQFITDILYCDPSSIIKKNKMNISDISRRRKSSVIEYHENKLLKLRVYLKRRYEKRVS